MEELALSVVIIAYNMARELPRTVRSLSIDMQKNIALNDYEIIVVDNGSNQPFDEAECLRWGANISVHYMKYATVSPAAAINYGLKLAKGKLVGVWIDGARLASPGVLSMALYANRMHAKPVIATISFHIGPDWQHRSILRGYNQAVEDKLLEDINWTKNPYALFDISVVAGSSALGWFGLITESNGLFLTKTHWSELGGFDERFKQPGGGMVNLDTWKRAVSSSGSQLFVLLGEGTFHQIHGGIASNSTHGLLQKSLQQFKNEYEQIHQQQYAPTPVKPIYIGEICESALKSIEWSAWKARGQANKLTMLFRFIWREIHWFVTKRLKQKK